MKEFVVLRAHDFKDAVGTLRVTDEVAAELAAHFKNEANIDIRLGAGYRKLDDGEIEIKEVSLLISEPRRLPLPAIREGNHKGNTNSAPKTPKPNIAPPAQGRRCNA